MTEDPRAADDPRLAHRLAEVQVTVLGPDGRPAADTDVTVAQRRHTFLFGCTGFEAIPLANEEAGPTAEQERVVGRWLDLFNFATLPFYWAEFEPERGHPGTARLLRAAQWFARRGCVVKGHPLAWHTLAPPWLLGRSPDEVADLLQARIRREVTDFAGRHRHAGTRSTKS